MSHRRHRSATHRAGRFGRAPALVSMILLAGGFAVAPAISASRVPVNLLQVTKADDGTDTLTTIENVVGSPFNDVIVGNAASNTLTGLGGDDTLRGDLGNDVLDGGAGIDTAAFNAINRGVDANLAT